MSTPGPVSHATYRASRFFVGLDGLRCLSIFLVVWHHTEGREGGLFSKGYLGATFFFVMSGFLITTLLLREKDRTGDIALPSFFLRRALRLLPLYYVVLGLYVALVLVLERGTPAGEEFLRNLPAFLTLTSNWFVELGSSERIIFYFSWSLATELQFYLFWPWLVKASRRWWVPAAAMAALILADLGAEWAVAAGSLDRGHLPVRILTSFATPVGLGCLVAYALHRPASFRVASALLGYRWSAVLAAGVLALLLPLNVGPAVVSLAMVLIVATCCMRADHLLGPVLSNRVTLYVGGVTYGIYLLHMLTLNTVRVALPGASHLVTFVVAALATTGCAVLSQRYFEGPILALKERAPRVRQPAVAPAVVPKG